MFGVVWKYTPVNGETQRLMAHPESLEGLNSVEKAQQDGRQTLADLPPELKTRMTPLSVVELNENMVDELNSASMVELDELLFVNVDSLSFWASNPWWSK